MTETMSLERLRALLDRYGAANERWPQTEREAAAALLADSTQARAMQQAASRLDRLLDGIEAPDPSPGLAAGIAKLASRPQGGPMAHLRAAWPSGPLRAQPVLRAAAFAAVGLFGLLVGIALPHDDAPGRQAGGPAGTPGGMAVVAVVERFEGAPANLSFAPASDDLGLESIWEDGDVAGGVEPGDPPGAGPDDPEGGIGQIAALDRIPLI